MHTIKELLLDHDVGPSVGVRAPWSVHGTLRQMDVLLSKKHPIGVSGQGDALLASKGFNNDAHKRHAELVAQIKLNIDKSKHNDALRGPLDIDALRQYQRNYWAAETGYSQVEKSRDLTSEKIRKKVKEAKPPTAAQVAQPAAVANQVSSISKVDESLELIAWRQQAYAEPVRGIAEDVVIGRYLPAKDLVPRFMRTASKLGDPPRKSTNIYSTWLFIQHIGMEVELQGKSSPSIRNKGSRNFLEHVYYCNVIHECRRIVNGTNCPRDETFFLPYAGKGSAAVESHVAVFRDAVQSFSAARFPSTIIQGIGYPIWACIFLCLRSGRIDVAAQIARKGADFGIVDHQIFLALTQMNSDGLVDTSSIVQRAIEDPFYRATVELITKSSPSGFTGGYGDVIQSYEDDLWWRLWHETTTRSTKEHALLEGNEYHSFQMAFVAGLQEEAIKFLVKKLPEYKVEAIHYVIAMTQYNSLTFNGEDMVRDYSAWIAQHCPFSALCYLVALRNEVSLRKSLIELCVTHQMYEKFCGSAIPQEKANGCVRFLGDDFWRDVVNHCIKHCLSADVGRADIAVELLLLLPNMGEVYRQMNSMMSRAICRQSPAYRTRVYSLMDTVQALQQSSPAHSTANSISELRESAIFKVLCGFIAFVRMYADGKAEAAAEELWRTGVFPVSYDQVESKVDVYKYELDSCIKDCIPSILALLFPNLQKLANTERTQQIIHCMQQYVPRVGLRCLPNLLL